jgi:hypothetical protein
MTPNPSRSDEQLIAQFLTALQELPNVQARPAMQSAGVSRDRRSDVEIEVKIGDRPLKLFVEIKKSVYPRDVREMLWQLRQFGLERLSDRANDVALLVAESISPGAKELLREERVGYYDTGGSLYLSGPGVYLYIDKAVPQPLTKSVRTLFSGRRAQVLHALLAQPHYWFGVKELAQRALVSPATASQTLTGLERFDWMESRGQGPVKERRLIAPGLLLDAWARQLVLLRSPVSRRYYVPSMGVENLIDRIAHECEQRNVEYAITHEAAAQRYAPFLSSISQLRCRLLADNTAAEEALAALDARVVREGANLVIMEAKSHGELLFKERVGEVWLASPVQVYLDLVSGEGRAKEMAEHLRHEKIGF